MRKFHCDYAWNTLALSHRTLPYVWPAVRRALFIFLSEQMANAKPLQVTQNPRNEFKIVCINCDALGIVFDCPEDAPSSTPIKCSQCGALRGTLGDLRNLSCSDRQDHFDA